MDLLNKCTYNERMSHSRWVDRLTFNVGLTLSMAIAGLVALAGGVLLRHVRLVEVVSGVCEHLGSALIVAAVIVMAVESRIKAREENTDKEYMRREEERHQDSIKQI